MQPTLDPTPRHARADSSATGLRCCAVLEIESLRLLECDLAFERLVGRSLAELRGVPLFEFLGSVDPQAQEAVRLGLELRAGHPLRFEARRPAGDVVSLELEARQFERRGKPAIHTVWHDPARPEQAPQAHPDGPLVQKLDLLERLCVATTTEELARALYETVGAPLGFDGVMLSRIWSNSTSSIALAAFPPGNPAHQQPASFAEAQASEELRPHAEPEPSTALVVRDSRGQSRGVQLTFFANSAPADLELKRPLAIEAANYLLGAYERLQLEISRELDESILRALLTKTSAVTGKEFFHTLVQQLAHALGVEYVLATRYAKPLETHLGAISFWADGKLKLINDYPIQNTPCKTVLERGELVVETGVQELYPLDSDLVELDVDTYVGVSIRDSGDATIGHLCVLGKRQISNPKRALDVLRFFGTRIAAELSRIDRDAQLQDALSSRSALIQLLEVSLSTLSLTQKLERSVEVLAGVQIGSFTNKFAIYLLDEEASELREGAQRGLEPSASRTAPDPTRNWFHHSALEAAPTADLDEPPSLESTSPQTADFCIVPIRTEDQAFGLLAAHIEPNTTEVGDELKFLQAAASTLASLLERSVSQKALGDAEMRVLRSQRLEAVGQLAGGIAHDFNNLLTAILGNADLLDSRFPGLQELASIRSASESAGRLTSQLLAFTRRQVLKTERLDVGSAVSDVAQMLERVIPESITLKVYATPKLYFAKADAGQLQQVLINLVVNARDAMPKGGLLGIFAEELVIRCHDEPLHEDLDAEPGRYVVITVSDTGIGIAEESLERIFEPFYSTKQLASDSRSEGTGLGLSVVYGIVKQHGGYIDVRSEVGRGTTFRIYLAAEQGEAAPEPPAVAPSAPSCRGTASILVVEDKREVREIAASLLESLGYTVQTAAGGPEALARFSDPEFEVDAVLLDVVMPVMSGIQTFEKLRALRPTQKVIFMTGHDPTAGLKGLLSADRAALIHKPFTRSQLGERVGALIGTAALGG